MASKTQESKLVRFERWLQLLASVLRDAGHQPRLLYEDRHQGDLLVLSVLLGEELVEVQVHRGPQGAVVLLLAESAACAAVLARTIEGQHQKVPRSANAKRKFIHRVERLASHLAATYSARAQSFPEEHFRVFCQWLPATRVVGAEATFRSKEHEEPAGDGSWLQTGSKQDRRDARRFSRVYGARVRAKGQARVALHRSAGFSLGGRPLGVQQRKSERTSQEGVDGGDVMTVFEWGPDVGELAYEVGWEAGDVAGDLASVAGAGDCGGFDLPDLACDMPDCSCDF